MILSETIELRCRCMLENSDDGSTFKRYSASTCPVNGETTFKNWTNWYSTSSRKAMCGVFVLGRYGCGTRGKQQLFDECEGVTALSRALYMSYSTSIARSYDRF
ncbi:hypothetical protein AVEN_196297-1 [Araneus ventricosus]|uniref:Uncharacterized protein n=1 Tax=Araneus ventricosus TaxID=182803 RepID=A0A4Y2LQC2_ARAVE|nr:hypothetical protein AVEN_196297-1 [Araneus ventricosus]